MKQHPPCKNEYKNSCTPWSSNYIAADRDFSISFTRVTFTFVKRVNVSAPVLFWSFLILDLRLSY